MPLGAALLELRECAARLKLPEVGRTQATICLRFGLMLYILGFWV